MASVFLFVLLYQSLLCEKAENWYQPPFKQIGIIVKELQKREVTFLNDVLVAVAVLVS